MRFTGRYIFAAILILLGLAALFDINFWRLIWPILLILLGIRILTRDHMHPDMMHTEETYQNDVDESVVFSGIEKKVISDNFQGGKVTAVFGGGTLDLSKAKIPKGKTARLEVSAVFGGFKVIVPSTWLVSSSVVGVLGGFTNGTQIPKEGKETGRLLLKGNAVFGGGEVVNG